MILENMNPVVTAALDSHPRSAHFRESVNIERLDSRQFLDPPAHSLGPRLRTEEADADRKIPQIHAHLTGLLAQMNEIGRRTADSRHAEIAHQHHLPFGVSSGGRNHGCAEGLHAVVGAETAGEQSVSIGVLNNVAAVDSPHRKCAHHAADPHINILFGVADNDRFSGRSAGGVQPDHLFHIQGKKTERIGVPQILFHHERQFGNIFQRADVGGFYPLFIHSLPIHLHVAVLMLNDLLKPLELNLPEQRTRNVILRTDRIVMFGQHRSSPVILRTTRLCGTPPD